MTYDKKTNFIISKKQAFKWYSYSLSKNRPKRYDEMIFSMVLNFHRRPKDANVQEWTRTSQDEDLWDFLTENSDGYISVRESFWRPKMKMSTFRGYLTQWDFLVSPLIRNESLLRNWNPRYPKWIWLLYFANCKL